MTDSPPVVHLHIGTMKTGTSYIQGLLERDKDQLADEGVLVRADVGRAVHDVLGMPGPRSLGPIDGAWDELVSDIRAWRGHSVIVSMEFLALATRPQIRQISTALAPSQVRAVLTVRDLSRVIRSAWQQTTKNRQSVTWPDFLDGLMAAGPDRPRTAKRFWAHHDVPNIAAKWAGVLGPSAVTLVTIPSGEAPPDELWRRFCTAVELDSDRHGPDGTERRNASMGYAEAEFLRRLNANLGRELDQPSYRRLVTGVMSRQLLRQGNGPASRSVPELPPAIRAWAKHRTAETIETISALGVAVAGSLDDLRLPPSSGETEDSPVSDAEVSAVAVHVSAGLIRRLENRSAANAT